MNILQVNGYVPYLQNVSDNYKDMKKIKIIFILLIPLYTLGTNPCDSTLFEKLIDYSEQETISYSEFLICKIMIDSLDKYDCDYYNKLIENQNYSITSLTFLFGKICYKANTSTAIKAFLDYRIKHIGSAEEQISFSFEPLFSLQPKLILDEMLKENEGLQEGLLYSLVWGFLNKVHHKDEYF